MLVLLAGLIVSLDQTGCQTAEPTEETAWETHSQPEPLEPQVSERLRTLISGIESEDYSVHEIRREDKAIRVDITLNSDGIPPGEVKRITLNALYDVQALLGKEQHLAIWSHSGEPLTIRGMAFYSSLTETYVFKKPEELN